MKSTRSKWHVYKKDGNWRVSYSDAMGVIPIPVIFVSWRDAMSYVTGTARRVDSYPPEVPC